MKKLKNYRITKKMTQDHKGVWNTLHIITFIPICPLIILEKLAELFEAILSIVASGRTKLINTIFKLMYKKECKYYEENED